VLLLLLSDPNIASKRWVFQQYDHEVGIRTVAKPGSADAALLRLDRDDKLLSIKLDGNSKHCYLDPYQGTLGLLSEGRRNVICTGASPVGVVDHLQFASPEDPEVFWAFVQAINAIIDYCKFMSLPVVGGKVSFYNETASGPIKHSPVMGTLGLVDRTASLPSFALGEGQSVFAIGRTAPEMGGSEYYEFVHKLVGGTVPAVDLQTDKKNGLSVLRAIQQGLVECAHDCSKGGIGVGLAEMAILGDIGLSVNLDQLPNSCSRADELLFSESHSRYLVGTKEPEKLRALLSSDGIPFAELGRTGGKAFDLHSRKKSLVHLSIEQLKSRYCSLEKAVS
jgi:phosphoribosylformylglycinamidine synthase